MLFSLLATFTLLHAEPVRSNNRDDSNPFLIEFIAVRDLGNVADSTTKLGAVVAPYEVGKYEVTVAQYCAFLNAVASKADPHGLYNPEMANDSQVASINRTVNADGTFTYTPLPNTDQLPVTHVRYNNTLYFCNWSQNGMPTALQGDDVVAASIEDGAYTFTQLPDGTEQAALSTNAIITLPTEDQWMKAAYYAGNGTNSSYWMYPTQHNTAPNDGYGDSANAANWDTVTYAPYWTSAPSKSLAVTPVNEFAQTMSAYQACDMGGNVNEWMMRSNEVDPANPLPITRGGSWASKYYDSYHWALSVNDLMRTAPAGTYDSDSAVLVEGSNQVGFRLVCSVVPPESTGGSGGDPSNNPPNEQASNQRTWVQWWDTCPWYEKVVIGVGGVAAVVTVATVGAAVASGVDVPAAVFAGAVWLGERMASAASSLTNTFRNGSDWLTGAGERFVPGRRIAEKAKPVVAELDELRKPGLVTGEQINNLVKKTPSIIGYLSEQERKLYHAFRDAEYRSKINRYSL